MNERLLIALVLLVSGFIAYQSYSRYHLRRASANAISDPLLSGLRRGVPTILYFTTPTCIPCKTQQQPALERLQSELGDEVQVVQVDATQEMEAANRWGVITAPTTFILDGSGHARDVNYGVADIHKLKRQIKAAVTL